MNVLSKPCVNIFRPWRTWTWTIFRVFHSVVTTWRKFVFPIGFESVWKRKQKKTSPRGSRCANNPLSWVQIQLVASAVLRNLKFSCNWKRKTDSNHSTIWGLVASVRKWNNHSRVFVVSVKIDCSVAVLRGAGIITTERVTHCGNCHTSRSVSSPNENIKVFHLFFP